MYEFEVFESCISGPRICLIGGVHGNERCGVNALDILKKEYLKNILKGQIFILVANPEAVRLNQRFLEFDLNRCFGNSNTYDYESVLAKKITSYLYEHKFEYVLDLHSTSSKSIPFCTGIKTRNHLKIFRKTQLNIYMHGWEKHRGHNMLIDEVNRLGGTGIIAECGQNNQQKTNHVALWVAVNFLKGLKLISDEVCKQVFDNHLISYLNSELGTNKRKVIEIRKIIKAKTPFFYFTKQYNNLEHVKAQEVIAYDGAYIVKNNQDFLIAMPTIGALQVGDEAFGIGVEDTTISA